MALAENPYFQLVPARAALYARTRSESAKEARSQRHARVSGSHPERMRTLSCALNGGRTHTPVRLSISDVTQRRTELEPGLVKEVPGSGRWLAPA